MRDRALRDKDKDIEADAETKRHGCRCVEREGERWGHPETCEERKAAIQRHGGIG